MSAGAALCSTLGFGVCAAAAVAGCEERDDGDRIPGPDESGSFEGEIKHPGLTDPRFNGLSNRELNKKIGSEQRNLLKTFFGKSVEGARHRAENFSVPNGLTRDTLEIYREVAARVIEAEKDTLGVQRMRLQLIERALQGM